MKVSLLSLKTEKSRLGGKKRSIKRKISQCVKIKQPENSENTQLAKINLEKCPEDKLVKIYNFNSRSIERKISQCVKIKQPENSENTQLAKINLEKCPEDKLAKFIPNTKGKTAKDCGKSYTNSQNSPGLPSSAQLSITINFSLKKWIHSNYGRLKLNKCSPWLHDIVKWTITRRCSTMSGLTIMYFHHGPL